MLRGAAKEPFGAGRQVGGVKMRIRPEFLRGSPQVQGIAFGSSRNPLGVPCRDFGSLRPYDFLHICEAKRFQVVNAMRKAGNRRRQRLGPFTGTNSNHKIGSVGKAVSSQVRSLVTL